MAIQLEESGGKLLLNEKEIVTVELFTGGLGLTGETWIDETANRTLGATYSNDNGKPILVMWTSSGGSDSQFFIDGTQVTNTVQASGNTNSASVIIPVNSTYKITGSDVAQWMELK